METPDILLATPQAVEALPRLTPPLLAWYKANARDLPWRQTPTPYRVWVSEIMLQQTRVEAVKGYYRRFLEALPHIPALAAAPEDQLLKLWEGLGYYSRVRNLQRAAQVVCRDHGGDLPASYQELLRLPGIGEYTAGAVASIAFGIPQPAVDGNVYRVLSRILASYADTSRPQVKRAFRACAASMLPAIRPGDLNQALMELGATVCLPNSAPLCGRCPVAGDCLAQAQGCALELPVKPEKKPRRVEQRTVLVVIAQGKVLLVRREQSGLLAGMLAPPHPEGHLTAGEAAAALAALGGHCHKPVPLRAAKHLFTHVEWQLRGYLLHSAPFAAPANGLWADKQSLLEDCALPSAFSAYTGELPLWLEQYPR